MSAQKQFLEYIVNKWAEKNRIESTGEETKADESFAAIASNLVTNWENEGLKSKFIEEIKTAMVQFATNLHIRREPYY